MKMYCKQCKITYHANEKFCRLCGEKLHGRKKEKRRNQKSQPPFRANIYLLFGLGLAIIIIALLLIDRPTQRRAVIEHNHDSKATTTFTSVVYEVAEKFICPCGGCGEMALETCSCDMHQGAIEAKSFIQQQLNQGKSKDEVIAAMIQRYGYLKPEYQKDYLMN
jgi:cytochrome c-type biogenesis protein CcmH/NrfF